MEIRKFEDKDASGVLRLMVEMTEFYGAEQPCPERALAHLMLYSKSLDIYVAVVGNSIRGFSVSGVMFPVASLVPFTYVQQVYVDASARRTGIARSLMRKIASSSLAAGIHRVEWSTSVTNVSARSLYETTGAKHQEKLHYALYGSPLAHFAADLSERD